MIDEIKLRQIAAAMLIDCHKVEFNNISMAVDSIVLTLTGAMTENRIPHEVLEIEDAVIDSIVLGLKLCRRAS